jgi:chaperone required for assembly of F1-ATPase
LSGASTVTETEEGEITIHLNGKTYKGKVVEDD